MEEEDDDLAKGGSLEGCCGHQQHLSSSCRCCLAAAHGPAPSSAPIITCKSPSSGGESSLSPLPLPCLKDDALSKHQQAAHQTWTTTTGKEQQLAEWMQRDVEPQGARLLLPFLTTYDRLHLSACCRALLRYRNHLSFIEVPHHHCYHQPQQDDDNPPSTSGARSMEQAVIRLLCLQAEPIYLCLRHQPLLGAVMELISSGQLQQDVKGLYLCLPLRLTDGDLCTVGAMLAKKRACHRLEELRTCLDQWLRPTSMVHLMQPLSRGTCPFLRRLQMCGGCDLRNGDGGGGGANIIGEALQPSDNNYGLRCLEDLSIYGIQLGDEGVMALAHALQDLACPQLRSLTLPACQVGHVGISSLAAALHRGSCPRLEVLNLSQNRLVGDDGVVPLAQALEASSCPLLYRLELHAVDMGPAGGQALARAISPSCKQLQHLDLSGNDQMGDTVVGAVVQALTVAPCQHLRYLNLCETAMGSVAADALLDALRKRVWPRLDHLDIASNCDIPGPAMGDIISALGHPGAYAHLKHLIVHDVAMGRGGGRAVVEALRQRAWFELEVLGMSEVHLRDDRLWRELVELLEAGACPKLTKLVVDRTDLGEEGAQRLCQALRHGACPRLEWLFVTPLECGDWEEIVAARGNRLKIFSC